MTIRAIIAEDELVARKCISAMCKAYGIEVVAECKDGNEAVHDLNRFRVDLLFLDVEMPGIDGFGVLQGMQSEPVPPVIFTTAYHNYAVRAFEHNAVDYLLKPFDEERFRKAVDRARLKIGKISDQSKAISQLLAEFHTARQAGGGTQRLVVRSRGQIKFVRIEEIDWIEASHNHVKLHVGAEVHLLRETITEIEGRLQPDQFMRIHRSLIVNVDRIRELESCGYGEYLVVLRDGKKLSLSRGFRDRLDRFVDGLLDSSESFHCEPHPD